MALGFCAVCLGGTQVGGCCSAVPSRRTAVRELSRARVGGLSPRDVP